MQIKFFEVRDEGTCIAIMAIKMDRRAVYIPDAEDWNRIAGKFLRRCGYPLDGSAVIYLRLADQRASVDPYSWGDRTDAFAHEHIYMNFDTLQNGQVVDVRVMAGETAAPAAPEIMADAL